MLGCIVKSILSVPFSQRPFAEKREIIKSGRPTPNLPDLIQQYNKFTRHFQSSTYCKCGWLAGSSELNALYCWNCLLFGKDRETSWTKTGFTDLKNLATAIGRHETTVNHLRASLCLANFGQSRIDTALDLQLEADISLHNQRVQRNREILKRLINAVCFLGKQELAFRGHDEKESSVNRGNYVELLKYTAQNDPLLADHLENATVFKGTSNRIQNDLIEAISAPVLAEIKREVKEAHFVSAEVDETTDVSTKSQFSIVLRYVYGGEAKERFIGFSDVSSDKHAEAFAVLIRQYLTEFECDEKLVAQAYDGCSTMAGHLNGVQAKIKESHPSALFVHCYAHVLNLVLSQSVSSISECKVFFSTLNGMAAFFSRSPKRVKFLDEFLHRRLPRVCPTRWNYSSRLVNTVHDHRSELISVFNAMLEHPDEIGEDTLAPVTGYLAMLQDDFQFNFLLNVFNRVYSHTDVLFDILQHQASDILYCRQKIEEVKQSIAALRDKFDVVFQETVETVGEPRKRTRRSTNFKQLYYEVIDNICGHLDSRFQDYDKLKFLSLLAYKDYDRYQQTFPDDLFQSLLATYGQFFDKVRLKNELIVLYSSEEFKGQSIANLAKLFGLSSVLRTSFPQLDLLVSLIYTIPVSTAAVERSFSALKRIKTYSRNTTGEERLSHLAVLSIESCLLTELKSKNQFYEDVIEKFCAKERRVEFEFR